jgi:hypothetical protein
MTTSSGIRSVSVYCTIDEDSNVHVRDTVITTNYEQDTMLTSGLCHL